MKNYHFLTFNHRILGVWSHKYHQVLCYLEEKKINFYHIHSILRMFFVLFPWNRYRALCREKKVAQCSFSNISVFLRTLGGTLNQKPSAGDFPEAACTLDHISTFCYVRGILLPKGLTHDLQATRIIRNKHFDVFQLFLTLHDPF